MENKMFCYQCQETAGGKGCTVSGVCGKKPDVAAMQDLLIYATKGLSAVATQLREEGKAVDKEVNHLVTILVALFGGWICKTLGIETLFILSAVLGLCNSAYAATIKTNRQR